MREMQAGWSPRRSAVSYLGAVEKLLHAVHPEVIERITMRLDDARERGATIYVAGNGGSAAIASHWVNDLGKATKRPGRRPIRAMCLSDNVSWLTALANDEGYERIFTGQLENFAREGDVLVVVSSSGSSANLVRAVELARSRKLVTMALVGFDGGLLKDMVDEVLWLPTEKGAYALVEPAHLMVCHLISTCLAEAPARGAAADAM